MAIEKIYEMKNKTVGQAMEEFSAMEEALSTEPGNAIDALAESLELDFNLSDTEEKCLFANWKDTPNNIRITAGFRDLFGDVTKALWAAYFSIGLIIGSTEWFGDGSGRTGYLQVFVRFGQKYLAICEEDGIAFLLPEEY